MTETFESQRLRTERNSRDQLEDSQGADQENEFSQPGFRLSGNPDVSTVAAPALKASMRRRRNKVSEEETIRPVVMGKRRFLLFDHQPVFFSSSNLHRLIRL
jgi:hypothetical protein